MRHPCWAPPRADIGGGTAGDVAAAVSFSAPPDRRSACAPRGARPSAERGAHAPRAGHRGHGPGRPTATLLRQRATYPNQQATVPARSGDSTSPKLALCLDERWQNICAATF